MSEKSDRVVSRTREMIVAITDPEELRRQLEEMLTEEFPPPAPPFVDGEVMTLQEFVNRFERRICRGVVPDFARREAWILHAGERLLVSIDAGVAGVPKVPNVPAVPVVSDSDTARQGAKAQSL